jgi:hypothetical protein
MFAPSPRPFNSEIVATSHRYVDARLQRDSRLFQLPFDIRRSIYEFLAPIAVHVHVCRARTVVSECSSLQAMYEEDDGSGPR